MRDENPYFFKSNQILNDMSNQIFNYNGNNVTFQLENGDVMVSATEMAKSFGKRPNDYLGLPSTNQLIEAITKKSGIAENQLVMTIRGGLNPSTWLHEDIALDFAQWLSIDFKLWCNDRIKELLKFGMTATQPTLEQMVNNPDLIITLATQLKSERAEKAFLAEQNQAQAELLEIQAPQVSFAKAVSDSKDAISMNDVAKVLSIKGYGQNKLFDFLRAKNILMYNNKPYQKYIDCQYFKVVEKPYRKGEETHIGFKTLVYQRGVDFIRKAISKTLEKEIATA